jgi:DNA-binding transcriptional MerR regulator
MPKLNIQKPLKPFKPISKVAILVGVEPHVLRFWEKEFSQIKPERSNGRRYYSNSTIENICFIRNLLYTKGYTIEGAKNYLKNNDKSSAANLDDILISLKNLKKILL